LPYRPWILIYTENFETRKEAMRREKFFKSGQGREEVKGIIKKFEDTGMGWYPHEVEND
jgi:putative endonuclease